MWPDRVDKAHIIESHQVNKEPFLFLSSFIHSQPFKLFSVFQHPNLWNNIY